MISFLLYLTLAFEFYYSHCLTIALLKLPEVNTFVSFCLSLFFIKNKTYVILL